jgi:carboxyl-terminal processing protease
MNSKRFTLYFVKLAVLSCFVFFNSSLGANNGSAPILPDKYKKILENLLIVMKELHFIKKPINDDFSKSLFISYLKNLPQSKEVFLSTDITALEKKYSVKIDDELQSKLPIAFFYEVGELYKKRFKEVQNNVNQILKQPLNFSIKEFYEADETKLTYTKNAKERSEVWKKRIKYLLLEKYYELKTINDKAKDKKTDEVLEKEAKEKIVKSLNKTLTGISARLTTDEFFKIYTNSLVHLYDPHTDYFPPIDRRSFNEEMSGRYGGIGAVIIEQDGIIKINSIVNNSPAFKSNQLQSGDIIIAIAQGAETPVEIDGFTSNEAVRLIRGTVKTEVRLTIKKQDGTVKVVSLIREELALDQNYVKSLVTTINGKKIGIINLPDFYADFDKADGRRCAVDVAKEITKLKAEQVEGIIMDLRNNGGGSLGDVIQMVGLFINKGTVVQVKDSEGKIIAYPDRDPAIQWDGPITVLTNHFSASASEIFAAAIQDYKRGVVIGTSSTLGKGTVQRQIPLDFNNKDPQAVDEYGSLKLTMQKFYRVNGGSTQLKGVIPDVIFPDLYDNTKQKEIYMENYMPYDEIKASYGEYKPTINYSESVQKANYKFDTSSIYGNFKKSLLQFDSLSDAPISLTKEGFLKGKQQLKSISDKLSEFYNNNTDSINVQFMKVDEPYYFQDKVREDISKRLQQYYSKDRFLKEALLVTEDQIKAKAKLP